MDRIAVTCAFCHATRTVKPVAFRHTHRCKNCGAWAHNVGTEEQPEWRWYEATEDNPNKTPDKAIQFRLLFAQLAPSLPQPKADYKFHPKRKFMFDCAWPDLMFALEIDGGNDMVRMSRSGQPVVVGRHTKDSDYEKTNLACELGWRVARFTTRMLYSDPVGCVEQTVAILRALERHAQKEQE